MALLEHRNFSQSNHNTGSGYSVLCAESCSTRNLQSQFYGASRRVMLKISGEALQGGMGFGVDPQASFSEAALYAA